MYDIEILFVTMTADWTKRNSSTDDQCLTTEHLPAQSQCTKIAQNCEQVFRKLRHKQHKIQIEDIFRNAVARTAKTIALLHCSMLS